MAGVDPRESNALALAVPIASFAALFAYVAGIAAVGEPAPRPTCSDTSCAQGLPVHLLTFFYSNLAFASGLALYFFHKTGRPYEKVFISRATTAFAALATVSGLLMLGRWSHDPASDLQFHLEAASVALVAISGMLSLLVTGSRCPPCDATAANAAAYHKAPNFTAGVKKLSGDRSKAPPQQPGQEGSKLSSEDEGSDETTLLPVHEALRKVGNGDSSKFDTLPRCMGNLDLSAPQTEWELRKQVAAAYRLIDWLGWSEAINNHVTIRIPGKEEHFLINSFGMGFNEITASSLVKIDLDGNVVDPGTHGGAVNKAGFVIHSAVHAGRADAKCIMHTHERNITAVSCMAEGLLPLTQTALLAGDIAYHEFEGVALRDEERETLVSDLGQTACTMILRNHGVLTIGETVAEAFTRLFYAHRSAEIQVRAMSCAQHDRSRIQFPPSDAIRYMRDVFGGKNVVLQEYADAFFSYHIRLMDQFCPGYDQ